jgi:ABC-type antimicrobial peptide transport system permease subunit
MLLSVIVGTSLSLIGVIYPAILAARMQPVEAMRLEH